METACHPDAIVHLEDVEFRYGEQIALRAVTLHISSREFVWVVGPNGGGKSTLLKLIAGLISPSRGSISLFGSSPREAHSRVGYLPQSLLFDRSFPVTVLDVVRMGRLRAGNIIGRYTRSDTQSAHDALERVGLSDMAGRSIGALSGGQLRRVFIARSLTATPDVLLLDEPTANLDPRAEEDLRDLLQNLSRDITIVMASHDPLFVSSFVNKVVCVNRSVSVHPTAELALDSLRHVYANPMSIVQHDRHAG